MFIDMMGPQRLKQWAAHRLSPRLEMFFAPTVIADLLNKWGREELDLKSDAALAPVSYSHLTLPTIYSV